MGQSSSSPSAGCCTNQPATRYGSETVQSGRSGFRTIRDEFASLEQVQAALRKEGLESSNLIIAVDFTKSNEWTGKVSNQGKSLHCTTQEQMNPYQLAVHIIGRTLSAFDDDNLIPCYGFGDASTGDKRVFSFKEGDAPCQGVEEAEAVYRDLVPFVKLAGPTSFAPAIHQAIKLVADSGNQYHVLLLIADGQVTRPSDMEAWQRSPQEQATIDAIVEASHFPLSIVMVGVGDGPWGSMKEFDDGLPARQFDNWQFVNLTELLSRYAAQGAQRLEAQFALDALMEIPEQYKAIQKLGLLGGPMRPRVYIPPPAPCPRAIAFAAFDPRYPRVDSSRQAEGVNPYTPSPSGRFSGINVPVASCGGGSARVSCSGVPHDRPSHASMYHDRTSNASSRMTATSTAAESLFVCPITQELMKDPVLAADGYSYERSAIEEWLRTGRRTSPMTNAQLAHTGLTPNHALRSSIQEYRAANNL